MDYRILPATGEGDRLCVEEVGGDVVMPVFCGTAPTDAGELALRCQPATHIAADDTAAPGYQDLTHAMLFYVLPTAGALSDAYADGATAVRTRGSCGTFPV